MNDFLQKIPVPQHEELRELATKFKNLIINAFENCIHKIEWEICNDELGYDSTIISMEEYTAEVDKICENIRKLIISSDNMSTTWSKFLKFATEIKITYGEDPESFSSDLVIFHLKFAESVEKLWLENYREEIDDTFPQTVTDLVLENCNLANIALPQKLKRLQVVGGDEPDENNLNTLKLADLKECLRRRPVPEQSWIDQPIEFSEIGDCSKLLYEHKNLDLYYSEKPLIYVGTDWERMSSELQKYTFSPEQIHHLCIVAIGFETCPL